MKEYTIEQRREYARSLPTKELLSLAETYKEAGTPGTLEVVIKDIIDAEVERRILNWEVACV